MDLKLDGSRMTNDEKNVYIPPLRELHLQSLISHDIKGTNKYDIHAFLFKAWQQQLTKANCVNVDIGCSVRDTCSVSAEELDYKPALATNGLSTELYLRQIRALDLEKEFAITLYSVPRQMILMVVREIISCDPQYCLKVVYNPALFIANSLDINCREELIYTLRRLVMDSITGRDQVNELLRSTAKHIECCLESGESGYAFDKDFNTKAAVCDMLVDHMYSSPLYSGKFTKKTLKNQQKSPIPRTPKDADSLYDARIIEHLQLGSDFSLEGKKWFIHLLAIFDYLAFVTILNTWVLLIGPIYAEAFGTMIAELDADDEAAISNILKFVREDNLRMLQPSKPTSRLTRISKRLHEDKIKYTEAIERILAYDAAERIKYGDNKLNKHEEAFVLICRTIRQNLNYDTSFALRSFNSELSFKMNSSTTRPVKKDLDEYLQWANESVNIGLPGCASLLKLMIQYLDLFMGTSFNPKQISILILENYLHIELYQSVKRIVKVYHKQGRFEVINAAVELLIEVFSQTSFHVRAIFRDYILHDRSLSTYPIAFDLSNNCDLPCFFNFKRPSNLPITSPTLEFWEIWPLDFEQRVTLICNQLVYSSDEPKVRLKQDNSIQQQIRNSLVLLSLICPYNLLRRLTWEAVQNKGQGPIIHQALCEIRTVCWTRVAQESPALLVMVFREILAEVDDGLIVLTRQHHKNWVSFIVLALTGTNTKLPAEMSLSETGEWGNIGTLIDTREYITHCVVPYLKNSTKIGREDTMNLSLSVLRTLLSPDTSKPPQADMSWSLGSNPFILLNNVVLLFDQRKKGMISMTNFNVVYPLLKELLRLLTGYIESPGNGHDRNETYMSNANKILNFYKKSLEYGWTTQLFLRSFIKSCANHFRFDVNPPYVPALLFSFCELSDQEFSEVEDSVTYDSELTMNQCTSLFLEACMSSADWCHKFSLALSNIKSISKPNLRNIFRSVAPHSFCNVLSNSVEEESVNLLDTLIKNLISHGILSATELLTIDEEHKDINNSSIISELGIDERLSLCCVRYSLTKILPALQFYSTKKIDEKIKETGLMTQEEDNCEFNQGIQDLRVVQNIIHVIKTCALKNTDTLNYLILLFYSTAQALLILSYSPKSEECLYIFLLNIVEMIDRVRTEIQKNQQFKSQHNEKIQDISYLAQNSDEPEPKTDTTGISEKLPIDDQQRDDQTGPVALASVETSGHDNYSEWQKKIILCGIDKIKRQNGWRDA
ncbi:17584_t:CDS:10, partial [Acaulospora morrowiae]